MEYSRNRMMPPAVKVILIINIAVYLLMYIFPRNTYFYSFIMEYCALFPIGGGDGMPSFHIWQLITHQFIHGGFSHILFNMFALWMFGIELEAEWGSKKFTIFYLLSGIGAGLCHLIISPLFSSPAPTVGASGALYGLFAAYAMINPNSRIMIFPIFIPIKAKFVIIGMIVIDLLLGFGSSGNIAHFAHVGGALTGFILMKTSKFKSDGENSESSFFPRKKSKKTGGDTVYSGNIYQTDWVKPEENNNVNVSGSVKNSSFKNDIYYKGEKLTQETIDKILDKISEKGYAGLTDEEKSILFEISKKM